MTRIYFDSNVFANLKKDSEEKYQKINQLINIYRRNLSFFFSHAHIRDKKKDTTDFKFDDFDFIESLTGNNYISYHGVNKKTSFYLATPKMVYDDEEKEDEFDILKDFWLPSFSELPEISFLKNLLRESFSDLDIPINQDDIKSLSSIDQKVIANILPPGKDSISMVDIMEKITELQYSMLTNTDSYKELRDFINRTLNEGKFYSKDGSIDFDEAFKNSDYQKYYHEFVKSTLVPDSDGNIEWYIFFNQSYSLLDLMGISKEKLSKKNDFNNIFNDGLHSYYAQYFNYFVTDDKGTIQKTKALYNLYNIETKILTTNEFLALLPHIGKSTEENMINFFEKLANDIRIGERRASEETDKGYNAIVVFEDKYLNYFDQMVELCEGVNSYYYLAKREQNYLSQPNFKETGNIIDNAIRIFGPDSQGLGSFNFEEEVKLIEKEEWNGRFWKMGKLDLILQINKGSKTLIFWIGPINFQNN